MTNLEIFTALHMMMLEDAWIPQTVMLHAIAPSSVCDIGAGNGHWAIGAATVSGATEVTMIEDFTLEGMSPPFFWPTTADELLEHCQQQSVILGGNAIYHVLDKLPPIADAFDIIRLASLWEINEVREGIGWIIKHLAPKGILFVDHLAVTMVPNRVLGVIEQVQAKALKPLWFGGNQGAFCHYDYDCAWIQDALLAEQSSSYRARRRLFDDLPILQTKKPGVWMQQYAWD